MRKPVVARPTGRPVIPVAVDNSDGMVLVHSDGRVQSAAEIVFSEHDVSRMRAGYVCARCYEDLDTAFPDECPVCKFPMREKQSELFAKRFVGERWVGPTTTLEEEAAIMNELREKEARERGLLWNPSPIVVPRSL